jgi:type III restriction enzyme
MEFKFDASQEYQLDAIGAVVGAFSGQPRNAAESSVLFGATVPAISNRLALGNDALLANVRAVQTKNKVDESDRLEVLSADVDTADGRATMTFPNYSIDMETGTGKTYVYLRTALELYRQYGWRKYIVVVPSIAVREGVLSTLEYTQEHFRSLYNAPYHFFRYDSGRLSLLRQFAVSDAVEIMVMTLDSFNKDSNIVRQPTDMLQGETPLHLLQAAAPILILDEPQNMESDLSRQALATLAPLFTLRYSATHRVPYNRLYRLSPFEAYRQGLVKRIEVASVVKSGDAGNAFCELEKIVPSARSVKAKLKVYVTAKNGTTKTKSVTVSPGEQLRDKTNNATYEGISIEEINPAGFVRFSDRRELKVGEAVGADKEAIFEAQLRYMVEEHFRKQARLRASNIKVLSLCFIDVVANYTGNEAIIPMLFDKVFDGLKATYRDWKDVKPESVRIAYFAQRRRKDGSVDVLDSTGQRDEDAAAFNLIMRDKARLLSFDEPAAFIFSHSALREGWDSPNVFQICTLNQTVSDVKKRQEVGRGVRIAVNQDGARIPGEQVNVLTVVANQSYESYVDSLQNEVIDEFGEDGAAPKPPDARKRREVKLQKHRYISPEFIELWKRISAKTRYNLTINSDRLVEQAAAVLRDVTVQPRRIMVAKAAVRATDDDTFEAAAMTQEHAVTTLDTPASELLTVISELLQFSAPPIRISRKTILDVLVKSNGANNALVNPAEYASIAAKAIRDALAAQITAGIVYHKLGEHYEMTLFEDSFRGWEQYLVATKLALYDHVVFDSEVEKQFAEDLEARTDVKLYVKLPRWFLVQTPVGNYNPDWAIVLEERDEHGAPTGNEHLYLVRETKSTLERGNLRGDEAIKLDCGRKHFDALEVPFKVITSVAELG